VTAFAQFTIFPGVELTHWPYSLRPWQGRDLAWLVDAANDDEIARWTRLPQPFTARDGLAFLDRAAHGWTTGSHLSFAVVVAESGWLVGSISVAGDGELGWFTGPDARGRGVARAAASALTDWLREAVPSVRPSAVIGEGNVASERVATAIGLSSSGERVDGCGTSGVAAQVWR
jgi:RimJ/RimL family protein N-acetyltransferase